MFYAAVVITVLNAYSGFALVAEGFMLNNPLLTTVGSLIGVSGSILSYIMVCYFKSLKGTATDYMKCVAMNRSLTNVLFGGIAAPAQTDYKMEGQITKTNIEDTVDSLTNAENVIIVCRVIPISRLTCSRHLGGRIWDGCCESTICHIRNYSDAEEQRR